MASSNAGERAVHAGARVRPTGNLAQRASRRSTGDSIRRLEQRIARLQKTANDREARIQHRLSSLCASNDALQQCLEHISELASSTLRSVVDASNQVEIPNASPMRSPETVLALHTDAGPLAQQPPADDQAPYTGDANGASQHLNPRSRQPTSATAAYPSPSASHPVASIFGEATSPRFERRTTDCVNDELRHESTPSPLVFVQTPMIDSPPNAHPGSALASICTVLPLHLPPTCPLDEILHDFLDTRRDLLAQGIATETVVGPAVPTVKALLQSSATGTVHPLCGVMSKVLSTFAHVRQPEKLAFFYLMFHTMRWQILPSEKTYTAMPTWLRPTVVQVAVRHAAWLDNIPWPGVRDILIENADDHPFEMFSQYYSQNVSVNWKFDALDAVSDANNYGVLHSIFVKHISNLKNWTVTPEFKARFPYMIPAIDSHH